MTRTLPETDVANVLKYEQLIQAIEKAFLPVGSCSPHATDQDRGWKAIPEHFAGGGRGRNGRQNCVLFPRGRKIPGYREIRRADGNGTVQSSQSERVEDFPKLSRQVEGRLEPRGNRD
jgi:hypothetical protein